MIRVLPMDEAGPRPDLPTAAVATAVADPLSWAPHRRFMPSGRSALDAVLRSLSLAPEDDVFITNSSGQTYVSPCVTCTVFNHCRPSRVLTDRTRAIIVIHEYGYPHARLSEMCELAGRRGIPLIEDCAHSLDSAIDGGPLGSFADFAIFSLSKVLPVASGGVLVSAHALPSGATALSGAGRAAQAAYEAHLPQLPDLSRRRRRNYAAIATALPDTPRLLQAGSQVTPWYVGLLTADAPQVKRRSSAIEWGSTLREDLLLVTTNPFVEPEMLLRALKGALTPPTDGSCER